MSLSDDNLIPIDDSSLSINNINTPSAVDADAVSVGDEVVAALHAAGFTIGIDVGAADVADVADATGVNSDMCISDITEATDITGLSHPVYRFDYLEGLPSSSSFDRNFTKLHVRSLNDLAETIFRLGKDNKDDPFFYWKWISDHPPSPDTGYSFSVDPTIDLIFRSLNDGGCHSGASFAMCMRTMQYIAKHGWRKYLMDSLASS